MVGGPILARGTATPRRQQVGRGRRKAAQQGRIDPWPRSPLEETAQGRPRDPRTMPSEASLGHPATGGM
jgi:hypothetical protein